MTKLQRWAACIAFGVLAATCFAAGSAALEKSWGDECKGKLDKEKDRLDCCWLKSTKCKRQCEEEHFGNENAQDDCRDDCASDEAQCKKDVKGAAAPPVSTSTRPQLNPSLDERVCCQTGIRRSWTPARDCQTPKGQVVDGHFCSGPSRTTQTQTPSSNTRICCNAQGAHSMMTANDCRARHGGPVPAKMCQAPKLGVESPGGGLLKSGPSK